MSKVQTFRGLQGHVLPGSIMDYISLKRMWPMYEDLQNNRLLRLCVVNLETYDDKAYSLATQKLLK